MIAILICYHCSEIFELDTLLKDLLTCELNPWSRVLPQNLKVSQLVKFHAFYGT